jgi:predicted transcriptional regulator
MANTTLKDLKAELLANKGVRKAYDDLAPEYAVARAVIKARTSCGLTQAQLAERMNTSQSFIARIENASVLPTMRTFLRIAEATGTRARFELEAA